MASIPISYTPVAVNHLVSNSGRNPAIPDIISGASILCRSAEGGGSCMRPKSVNSIVSLHELCQLPPSPRRVLQTEAHTWRYGWLPSLRRMRSVMSDKLPDSQTQVPFTYAHTVLAVPFARPVLHPYCPLRLPRSVCRPDLFSLPSACCHFSLLRSLRHIFLHTHCCYRLSRVPITDSGAKPYHCNLWLYSPRSSFNYLFHVNYAHSTRMAAVYVIDDAGYTRPSQLLTL